jgi:diaminopimelate decarboxylase
MTGFRRDAQGRACLGGALVSKLLQDAAVSTPAYFYDVDAIAQAARELIDAFGSARHVVAYAVKANTAGTIVRALAQVGTGADVVSGAELSVALGASVPPNRIVMSGVAKKDSEIDQALAAGILAIQAESVEEIARIAARARATSQRARVSLRINPGVEIDSHSHIATGHDAAKFGITRADLSAAWQAIDAAPEALVGVGVSTHVGSMLTEPDAYLASARSVCEIARSRRAQQPGLEYVDFGGGFGIDYGGRPARAPADFARASLKLLEEERLSDLMLVAEPGRSLVGPYGILVANVVQAKQSGERRWAMIDAGMNDLIRPALYGAKHRIEPLDSEPRDPEWRVVGPVCESSDDFGAHPLGPELPELVVIRDAGAYGFVMASEYNGRALASEVFVANGAVKSVSRSPGVENWVSRRLDA